jgi:hypothetical protein
MGCTEETQYSPFAIWAARLLSRFSEFDLHEVKSINQCFPQKILKKTNKPVEKLLISSAYVVQY